MSYQFPPSSPVLEDKENIDPRPKVIETVEDESVLDHLHEFYPTPNPSSTTGRHTEMNEAIPNSLAEVSKVDPEVTKQTAQEDVHESLVEETTPIIRIPGSGEEVSIGRSSKNDFKLSNNKQISRCHIQLSYDNNTDDLKVRVLGHNGVNVTIPYKLDVQFTEVNNEYKLSRYMIHDKFLTNFNMFKDETIVFPYHEGVIFDIKGEVMKVIVDGARKRKAEKPPQTSSISDRSSIPQTKSRAASPATPARKTKRATRDDNDQLLMAHLTDEEIDGFLQHVTEDDLHEICKILINHLAFSRLQSTPLRDLQKVSQRTQVLTKRQLRVILIKKIPCIGVIYRSGKDAAGELLDEEYYYDVDKDDDSGRVSLVNNLKGNSSIRNCRKQHKQYYWKKPTLKK